jgi:hypothetical protein
MAIDQAYISALTGFARNDGATSAGQTKHWLGNKIDDILDDVVALTATQSAILKHSTRNSKRVSVRNNGVKKRSLKRTKKSLIRPRLALAASNHSATELECAASLLELSKKPVIFGKFRSGGVFSAGLVEYATARAFVWKCN